MVPCMAEGNLQTESIVQDDGKTAPAQGIVHALRHCFQGAVSGLCGCAGVSPEIHPQCAVATKTN